MSRFSASDVALTGFGVVARRPAVLVWWILLHLVFMGGISVLLVTLAGPAMTQMMALRAQNTTMDPQAQAQMLALFGQLAPLYLVMFPLTLVFYAVLFAAMNRAVLQPAKSAFGYLRLGADEVRQFLLFLWGAVLAIGLEIVLIVLGIVAAIVFAIVYAALNKGAAPAANGQAAAVLAPLVFIVLFIAAYLFLMVRLSLASAMTFDTGKVSLLRSWRLTRGRFWSMFGAYVLATILSIVVSLLGLVVMIVCAMLAGGGVSAIFQPDMSSPAAYFTPARLVYLALSGVLYALVWPILLTPSAAIYKAITAGAQPTPASWPSLEPTAPTPFASTPAPAPFGAAPDDPERP